MCRDEGWMLPLGSAAMFCGLLDNAAEREGVRRRCRGRSVEEVDADVDAEGEGRCASGRDGGMADASTSDGWRRGAIGGQVADDEEGRYAMREEEGGGEGRGREESVVGEEEEDGG